MTARNRPGLHPATFRATRGLRGLASLALCDPEEFRARLEGRTGRPVRVEAVTLLPDAPSGVCLRTAAADHLYFEQQTSPFHQAHILTGMAAHLLAGAPDARTDPRLAPQVSPRLAGLILGPQQGRSLSADQAEALTFRALGRAGATACRTSLARWFLRQLGPLHVTLLGAVPEAAAQPCLRDNPSPRLRLYRQVIEIRDAMLALRPYRDPRVVAAAHTAASAAGLRCHARDAAVEAAVLATAVAAKKPGSPAVAQPGDVWQSAAAGRDLCAEARWLAKVSRELVRPLPLSQPRSVELLRGSPHAGELMRGIRPRTDSHGACLDGHLTRREARQLRRREDWRSQS